MVALLETKLYVPRRRRDLVPRPRLTERLRRVTESKLTLISAPAGFGKTTLLTDWVAGVSPGEASIAWLSLDPGDNQPAVFWTYVAAALDKAAPGACAGTSALIQSVQPPPIEVVLTTLINSVASLTTELVLVLDDYHLVDHAEIQEAMIFLLDHLPDQLHIVIASRADPALILPRLRVRGELIELRSADLRFSPTEASSYLNDVMHLDLAPPDLSALEGRTEGWIAALQLAALSIKGREDVAGFITGFAGDDRYIVDYLVQEVLQRQPAPVRDFLLQTSILDRLSGSLCDQVTDRLGGQAMLESLERANVFVVPLDDRRGWYRYHHLFADMLRAHLAYDRPADVPVLHARASVWFENNGDLQAAIGHGLIAADFERVADLVERAMPALLKSRQDATLRAWFEAIPDALLNQRPVLGAAYASVLLQAGELDAAEVRIRQAELCIDPLSGKPEIHVDEEEFRRLPGMLSIYRAALSQIAGNLPDTVKYGRRALELMPADDNLGRGAPMALLGLALWAMGDLDEARRTHAAGIALTHAAGYVTDSSAITLADMSMAQGRLREALGTYEAALQQASRQAGAAPLGVADLHAGISEVYLERGELDLATQHLTTAKELGSATALPENRYRWFVAMAGVERAQGNFDRAHEMLNEAERLFTPGFSPDVRPIAALRANLWIAQDRLAEAAAWVHEQGLSTHDDVSYLLEFKHLTLVRSLIAQPKTSPNAPQLEEALALLNRLAPAAEVGGRTGSLLEILVLQALTQQARGDTAVALAALGRALALAEPEGYVRLFTDQGPPMAALLDNALKQGIAPAYVRRLLQAFESPAAPSPSRPPGAELLSERELAVMRLLATDLSGPDIARELVVSLNTMRTHTKSIYTKLDVNSRREAVRRAQELHLL